jgi:hypothetical protein
MNPSPAIIEVNPQLSADQLFDFYQRNNICEVGFGKEVAARILSHPHLVVGAFHQGELVGLARATSDGLSAHVMELSVDLRWQGHTRHNNGSLVEADARGLGQALGERLLHELSQQGCTFVTGSIVDNCEEPFYAALGFHRNEGHSVFYLDKRPYRDASSDPTHLRRAE